MSAIVIVIVSLTPLEDFLTEELAGVEVASQAKVVRAGAHSRGMQQERALDLVGGKTKDVQPVNVYTACQHAR